MFELIGTHVRLTAGDTGILTILAKDTEYVFTENDKAVFTIKRQNSNAILVDMILQPEPDGKVQIPFTSDLTDGWKPGDYRWDIRYVLDAVMEDGRVVDGNEVITPMLPGTFTVVKAVGEI